MRVLATYNIKGGVGKTATAVNLAFLAASQGNRTLLWDLDPQGAATYYFRIEPRIKGGGKGLIKGKTLVDDLVKATDFEGLDLLPADFSYRNMDIALKNTGSPRKRLTKLLQPLALEYDVLILDCAPSISMVSESVFVAADALLVPTIPTTLSLRTLAQLRDHLDRRRKRRRPMMLPFFCLVDRRKRLHRDICDGRDALPLPFLRSEIPNASIVEQMGLRRSPVCAFAPSSGAASSYRSLWAEVAATLSIHSPGVRF